MDDLLGVSTTVTSMDFDPSSLEGDFDPSSLEGETFPDLTRMTRQYLTVPTTSVSPKRFFSVGLIKLYRLTFLKEIKEEDTHTHTHNLLTH